jgi:RNA polymerase sigma-70 factor (ECF subfamily)
MTEDERLDPEPVLRLDQISTEWSLLHDSGRFVRRYTPAIRKYLNALIKNRHDAEDVLQDFLLRVLTHGLLRLSREGGRFRDYLKVAVRHAALNHLQRRAAPKPGATPLLHLPTADPPELAADQEWVVHWRESLLDRAWLDLKRHQLQTPGNLAYTVLRLAVRYPEKDSKALATRASALTGRPLRAEAFRKQLSRARRLFAQFIVSEVALTLDRGTPEQVEEELCELGLLGYVRDFLPPGWREQGRCHNRR